MPISAPGLMRADAAFAALGHDDLGRCCTRLIWPSGWLAVAQPLIFAIQVGLTAAGGPGYRAGHGAGPQRGEIAAATVAGVVTLDEAARAYGPRAQPGSGPPCRDHGGAGGGPGGGDAADRGKRPARSGHRGGQWPLFGDHFGQQRPRFRPL
jgi:hypothetical protein